MEFHHPPYFFEFLTATPRSQNTTGLSVLSCAWATMGLSVQSSLQHVNLTQALDGNPFHFDLPFIESHCRLTQLWLVKWTSLKKM